MSLPIFHSIWTVLLMVIFVAIVLWAFSGYRKQAFDEAAQLPLEDDNDKMNQTGENTHG